MGAASSTPPCANESSPSPVRAVAYCRYAAESATKDGLKPQRDHVRTFARRHDIQIIHEFIDRGKSGRSAEGRPAFMEMMHWVRTRHDFVLILVFDGSRWGRFQADELAQYESLCTEHGKRVIYTTVGFTRDEDKLIHRPRKAPYGFHRMLLDQHDHRFIMPQSEVIPSHTQRPSCSAPGRRRCSKLASTPRQFAGIASHGRQTH